MTGWMDKQIDGTGTAQKKIWPRVSKNQAYGSDVLDFGFVLLSKLKKVFIFFCKDDYVVFLLLNKALGFFQKRKVLLK